MTAPSKNWTAIPDAQIASGKPIDQTLLTEVRDNQVNVQEWLGYGYTPSQAHVHDGVDSALIEVGPNMLRNGSFESGSTSWTLTANTGGTNAVGAAGAMHGANCLAITSTVLANGGGSALSNQFMPVAIGKNYTLTALFKGSVANISGQIEFVWYNAAQAQVSLSTTQIAALPTVATLYAITATPPATAVYVKCRVYGGVPGVGAGVGTVYIDDVRLNLASAMLKRTVYATAGTYTWTKSAGTSYVNVTVRNGAGGGGGGGDPAVPTNAGAGGAGGGYSIALLNAASYASQTITVGAGGGGGAAGTTGGAGGTSSFGALVSGGSGGDINFPNNSGGGSGGQGGGGGGGGGGYGNGFVGGTSSGGGGGGGGGGNGGNAGSPALAGGAGQAGYVIVEEYA